MSLSPEALAQLEGLDLQEAREGLNFVSAGGARESLGVDLSANELSSLRSWDLSGVLARLNGLTFEAVHPELVAAPVPPVEPPASEPSGEAAPAPDLEEELPDWLKPAEEVASPAEAELPAEETAASAPLPEELVPSGPTAEEAAVGLVVADSVVGSGRKIREFLRSKTGQKTLMGVEFVGSAAIGFIIADILRLGPGQEAAIAFTAQSALGLTRLGTELGARTVELAEVKFPRFANLSRRMAGEKGLAGVLRNIRNVATRLQYDPIVSGLTIGIIGHSFYEALSGRPSIIPDTHAAEPTPGPAATHTPDATPVPTGTAVPSETPAPSSTPDATPVLPDATPIPGGGGENGAGGQPPAPQPEGQFSGVGRPGEAQIPPEEFLSQPGDAELAAQQAAEAARQAAESHAATSVGITGADLSGGTIWGNELEFVKQLGVHHVEPVTNLLKNFSKVLAQAQLPTEIGPTDTAYVINRDVAGWAAGQADKLYGMDPSSMTSWQKSLWEIGRGLRGANWQDLQAVTEEFVKQSQP